MKPRCAWPKNPLAIAYHDREWGVPLRNERRLFECLILEGAQAGLSWDTILAKRQNYRKAFDGFDFVKVAKYGAREHRRLLADAGIVRHAGKIEAAMVNARAVLAVRQECGSFAKYVWSFTDAGALSKDLKKRGFRFVGPTTVYAFMQAVGMVNAHDKRCFRYREINAKA
ncbi:MAG: DNA-3-methyladenine glycosylase I [Burkholderiales bacterium]